MPQPLEAALTEYLPLTARTCLFATARSKADLARRASLANPSFPVYRPAPAGLETLAAKIPARFAVRATDHWADQAEALRVKNLAASAALLVMAALAASPAALVRAALRVGLVLLAEELGVAMEWLVRLARTVFLAQMVGWRASENTWNSDLFHLTASMEIPARPAKAVVGAEEAAVVTTAATPMAAAAEEEAEALAAAPEATQERPVAAHSASTLGTHRCELSIARYFDRLEETVAPAVMAVMAAKVVMEGRAVRTEGAVSKTMAVTEHLVAKVVMAAAADTAVAGPEGRA
jgi:hypothetical protein